MTEPVPALRVGVVGAGAVGTFLAALLASGGCRVVLVDRRAPERAAEEPPALELVGPGGSRRVLRLPRVRSLEALPADLDAVILAVRQFDVPEVADALVAADALAGAPAVTVQNGVGAEEVMAARRPVPGVVAASLTAAVETTSTGVRWLRRGGIGLAAAAGDVEGTVAALAGAFTTAGLPARVCPDAAAMKWSKLVANLVGNATSAIVDMDPAAIYADRGLFRIERRQLLEAASVLHALGLRPVALPGAHVTLLLRGMRLTEALARPVVARAIGGARGGKSPSLRLHVHRRAPRADPVPAGPSEVRWLNGAVAAAGERLGVPAPVNARLAALVEEVAADPARRAWFRHRPDRLRQAVEAGEETHPESV